MAGFTETLILTALFAAPGPPPPEGYCIDCHSKQSDTRLSVPTASIAASVHAILPGTCVACHGGDVREPTARAHDLSLGFKGKPTLVDIPKLCGSCHSDPSYMRPYSASLPVDQLALYNTSAHGKGLAAGHLDVATCVSCHGSHDIVRVTDAAAPVHPLNVYKTCGKCHGDPKNRARAKGNPDPVKNWKRSVHAAALFGGDVSAPTCNDCHGGHGASPPGVHDISRACGVCHAQQAQIFDHSPHKEAFDRLGFAECDECHGRHDIAPASDKLLRATSSGICSRCHKEGTVGATTAVELVDLFEESEDLVAETKAIAEAARRTGLWIPLAEVADREQFTANRRLRILVHTVSPEEVDKGLSAMRSTQAELKKAVSGARADLQTRRDGYIVFIVLIAGMVLLLSLKLRRLSA